MRISMTRNSFEPDDAKLLDIWHRVALLRINDEKARRVIRSGKIAMVYYSYSGQEIIPASFAAALRDDDYLCTIYRGIHDMLAKGFPLDALWAELAGKATGSCKGKGGPMHLTNPEKGIMVTTGIVGSSMPIANGLAWAAQLDGTDQVSVATFGDGASNIGAFHEALNMAAVWKLPTIFICQNNQYAEHTKFEKCTGGANVAARAAAYGVPGVRVDGNDPVTMYAAANEAVQRARAGEGPTLIEAMTFRFHGHVFGDDDSYMDKEQKKQAIANDPVPRFRKKLIDEGIATQQQLANIDAEFEKQIDAAIEHAVNSPYPTTEEIRRDVFAEEIPA
jgi:pyruvate dehydrogenase E1 component alpha subunit